MTDEEMILWLRQQRTPECSAIARRLSALSQIEKARAGSVRTVGNLSQFKTDLDVELHQDFPPKG